MLNASAALKAAINAPCRYVKVKVDIYFDGLDADPVTLDNDNVVDLELLEENATESDTPLGAVSSNELTLTLLNTNSRFTISNTSSPYYGKVLPQVCVKPYLEVEISEGIFEEITLGVYRTGNWSAPMESLEAAVTCHDRLYDIGNLDVPLLSVVFNTTIYDMFEILLQSVGLTSEDYIIDDYLKRMKIPCGWFIKDKVKAALQALCLCACCTVSCNRANKIVVHSNFSVSASCATMDDEVQIFTANCPQDYSRVYSEVKLKYTYPVIETSKELISLSQVIVPKGGITLSNIMLNSGPAATITTIALKGAKNTKLVDYTLGAWGITLILSNSQDEETIDIQVNGCTVASNEAEYYCNNPKLYKQIGSKLLTLETYLKQDLNFAEEYGNLILQLVSDPTAQISLTVRSNPLLELIDCFTVDDPTDKLNSVDVLPTRFKLSFEGGLSGEVEAVRRTARVIQDWVFISPGFCIQAERNMKEVI